MQYTVFPASLQLGEKCNFFIHFLRLKNFLIANNNEYNFSIVYIFLYKIDRKKVKMRSLRRLSGKRCVRACQQSLDIVQSF